MTAPQTAAAPSLPSPGAAAPDPVLTVPGCVIRVWPLEVTR